MWLDVQIFPILGNCLAKLLLKSPGQVVSVAKTEPQRDLLNGDTGSQHFAYGEKYGIIYVFPQGDAGVVFKGVAELAFGNIQLLRNILHRKLDGDMPPNVAQRIG